MKKFTVADYKQDKYYPKVVKAMNDELVHSNYVSPIVVFQRMALLEKKDVEEWRMGKVCYLEKV